MRRCCDQHPYSYHMYQTALGKSALSSDSSRQHAVFYRLVYHKRAWPTYARLIPLRSYRECGHHDDAVALFSETKALASTPSVRLYTPNGC